MIELFNYLYILYVLLSINKLLSALAYKCRRQVDSLFLDFLGDSILSAYTLINTVQW